MYLAFTCETVPATQDLCPRTQIFAFLQDQSSAQNLGLDALYVQHKKTEKDAQAEASAVHLVFM